jgi:HEAT repeat protein
VITALSNALRSDKDDDVRSTAAWALGNAGGRADVAILVAALGDASSEVRHRALWAIGQQGLQEAPARVVALLDDQDDEVRHMAAWVLGQILDRETLPAIREAFLAETDSDVAEQLFRALLIMGDKTQSVIDRAMASDDPQMRARGVRLIAGQGSGPWPWPWPWPWPRPSP